MQKVLSAALAACFSFALLGNASALTTNIFVPVGFSQFTFLIDPPTQVSSFYAISPDVFVTFSGCPGSSCDGNLTDNWSAIFFDQSGNVLTAGGSASITFGCTPVGCKSPPLTIEPDVIDGMLPIGAASFIVTNFLTVSSNGIFTSEALGIDVVDAVETPLPATLPLFATGLGALGLFGWRRKRRAKSKQHLMGRLAGVALCAGVLTMASGPSNAGVMFSINNAVSFNSFTYGTNPGDNNVVNVPASSIVDGATPSTWFASGGTGSASVSVTGLIPGQTYNVAYFYLGSESGDVIRFTAPGVTVPFDENNANNNCATCGTSPQTGQVLMGEGTRSTVNFTLTDTRTGASITNGGTNPSPLTGGANLIFSYAFFSGGVFNLTNTPSPDVVFGFNDDGGQDDNHDDFVGALTLLGCGECFFEPAPIPAALPLFGSTFAGALVLFGWRKKRRSSPVRSMHRGRRRRMEVVRIFLSVIAVFALLCTQASATVYFVHDADTFEVSTPGNGVFLDGTITTDGQTGILSQSDIVSWNLTIVNVPHAPTSTNPLGTVSDPTPVTLTETNSTVLVVGNNLSATPSALFFDYSSFATVSFNWTLGTAHAFVEYNGGPLLASSFVVGAWDCENLCGILFGGPPRAGIEEIADATPLPASLPLFATGLGSLGLFGWRKKQRR